MMAEQLINLSTTMSPIVCIKGFFLLDMFKLNQFLLRFVIGSSAHIGAILWLYINFMPACMIIVSHLRPICSLFWLMMLIVNLALLLTSMLTDDRQTSSHCQVYEYSP